MLFFLDNLQISQLSVSLQCVFHSIRFKVNKGWSTAVLLFLCPYVTYGVKSEFLRLTCKIVWCYAYNLVSLYKKKAHLQNRVVLCI